MGGKAMTSRQFQVWLEWDQEDSVWVTYVPTLGHLSTFGETREEALANTQEAILGYLEAAAKEGIPVEIGGVQAEIVQVEVAV
jgi:predicted RNase H-like HicB family nuclease